MKYTAATALALASSASAHMRLFYPKPFATPDNGPVDPSGSNFPCRVTGPEAYTATTPNQVKAGDKMTVEFEGSAVHGGGSCQFSLTTDTNPSKDSQWKVIHSVISGCLTTEPGNLGDDATARVATPVDVTIPSDLPDGDYTFGWSWINKVGNREFYHNCAPLSVSGGGSGDVSSALGGLPDMFVVNMPPDECATEHGQDFEFPNPGESVDIGPQASIGNTLIGGGCDAQNKLGAGSGSLGSPSPPSGGNPPSDGNGSTPSSTPSAAPIPTNPGGVFAPSASPAPPASTGSPSPAPETPPTTPEVPTTPETPETPTTPENPPASGECTPCDNDGGVVCIGSSQFGICNFGCAVPQALAAGMSCSNGAIQRRHIRRVPRGHLSRRHRANLL